VFILVNTPYFSILLVTAIEKWLMKPVFIFDFN